MSRKGLNVKRTWGGKEKIQKLIKQEKNVRVKERLQAILWRLKGETYTQIAKNLKTDWMDSFVVSAFLKELSAYYPDKKHFVIADNVAYHKSQGGKDFPLPENIELFFLPAYSPDLNPIERLWKYFKDEFLNNSLFLKPLLKLKRQFTKD